jgi:hypothetical protein
VIRYIDPWRTAPKNGEGPRTGDSATSCRAWSTRRWCLVSFRAIAVYSVAYLSNTDNCTSNAGKPVAYYASHGTSDAVLPSAPQRRTLSANPSSQNWLKKVQTS